MERYDDVDDELELPPDLVSMIETDGWMID